MKKYIQEVHEFSEMELRVKLGLDKKISSISMDGYGENATITIRTIEKQK